MSCCFCKSCYAIRTGNFEHAYYDIPREFTIGNKCLCWIDGVRCAFKCLQTECELGQPKKLF